MYVLVYCHEHHQNKCLGDALDHGTIRWDIGGHMEMLNRRDGYSGGRFQEAKNWQANNKWIEEFWTGVGFVNHNTDHNTIVLKGICSAWRGNSSGKRFVVVQISARLRKGAGVAIGSRFVGIAKICDPFLSSQVGEKNKGAWRHPKVIQIII